jgi:hypothetical protein
MTGKIWMHLDGNWVKSPVDPDAPQTRSAPARLFRLLNDGEFSLIECWLDEGKNRLSISPGDPHRIFVGNWTNDDGRVLVTYRLMFTLVEPVDGEQIPGSPQQGALRLTGALMDFEGTVYEEAKINSGEYEGFVRPHRPALQGR